MQLKNGCMAVRLMEFVGLCGEVPVSLVRKLPGYYDYNRRLVTRLVQEGYLKERRMKGYRRRIVRSLSLTESGLSQIQRVSPGWAQRIRGHVLAPENGHGNWKKTLRLHRGAACLLATMKLKAVWQPGRQKDAALGSHLTYYSAYELVGEYGWDNKGARLSGVLVDKHHYYPLYYLGDSNMRWSEEAEQMFLEHVEFSPLGHGRTLGSSLLLGENWDLMESLIIHAVNPRSRLVHFTKTSSFHYFTLDDMGFRLMKLLLDDTYLFVFQQHLLQNGVCQPSMLPGYLFSLELLSEYYDTGKGKRFVWSLNGSTFFTCQIDILKKLCKIGSNLLIIPDHWLLDFEMNAKTLEELRQKEADIQRDTVDGIDYAAGEMTVIELVTRYMNLKRSLKENSFRAYDSVINRIREDPFGQKQIRHVKLSDAKSWFVSLHDRGYKQNTIGVMQCVVRPAFEMAVDDDILRKNPFKFKLSDVVPRDAYVRTALSRDQQEQYLQFFMEYGGGSYYDDVVILLGTGLRVSELYGLTKSDLDFDHRCIHVRRQLSRTANQPYFISSPKTKSGIRTIPMTDTVYMALKRVLKNRVSPKVEMLVDGCTGFIFLDKAGKPKVAMHLENFMRGLQQKHPWALGGDFPRVTPHVLRHTFCTNMQQAGIDIKSLQYLMGHSNASVTLDVYTHTDYDVVKRAFVQAAANL